MRTPEVPSIEPANRDTATTPMSTSTMPLEAAMIADLWCHQSGGGSSYSGTSSRANHSSSTSWSSSFGASNDAALSGSGGGHILAHFHLAHVPSAMPIRHIPRMRTEGQRDICCETGTSHSEIRPLHTNR